MEQPERLIRPEPMSRSSGGQGNGVRELAKMLLPAVAVGAVLYLLVLPGTYVTQSADKINQDGIVKLVTSVSDRLKGDEGTLATIATQLTSLGKDVKESQSSVSSMSSTVAKISSIQQSIDSLSPKINGLPSQPDLTPLKTQLTALQTSLEAVKADVTSVKTDVAALKAPTVPVTTPPTLIGFSPIAGPPGTVVTITGTNFNGATGVTFGSTVATFTVNSATQITTSVPAGSATGAVNVTTPAGTATSTTTFTVAGTVTPPSTGVTAAAFNSPMIFVKPTSAGMDKTFGIKLVNSTADKDLVYVRLTVKMTITNLDIFDANGVTLTSGTGTFTGWTYERGLGNTATFVSEAYLYVPRGGGELSDSQKLHLVGDNTTIGTYTVTVTSVTIDSKTLQ